MAREKGSMVLPSNIELGTDAPLDARTVVETKADLTVAANFEHPYEGLPVYIAAEKKYYVLTALPVTSAANWKALEGGGGGTPEWDDIVGKPTDLVEDADYVHTDNNYTDADKAKLDELADIKTVGTGLALSPEGELSVSGSGESVDWTDIENKPADLVQDADYVHTDNNFSDAEKGKIARAQSAITTIEEAIDRLDAEKADASSVVAVQSSIDVLDAAIVRLDAEKAAQSSIVTIQSSITTIQTALADRYTKQETDDLIADELAKFDHLDYEIVAELPTTGEAGVRYLVKHPTDAQYEEHIYVNDEWHDIGSTSDVDLSDYYTKTQTNALVTNATAAMRYKVEMDDTAPPESMVLKGDSEAALQPTMTFAGTSDALEYSAENESGSYAITMPSKAYVDTYVDNKTLSPTGWGVVTSFEGTITSKTGDYWERTVDITQYGFTSASDYGVNADAVAEAYAYDSSVIIANKTATSFMVRIHNSNAAVVKFTCTIFAKGYGAVAYTGALPEGGTTGQALVKKSDADGDVEWADAGGGPVDQTYNATSENAQSGTAVAEALATVDGSTNFDVTTIPQGPTGANEINAVISNKDTENAILSYVRQADGTLPNTVNLGVKSGIGEDSFVLPTKAFVDTQTGDLTALETTAQDNLVNAVNELKSGLDGLGEPFRVKQWGSNTLNVEIPYCTEDIANASIQKMLFSISDEEGKDYQIVGMISYEVFDAESGGNRINCWPVCQFTGNGQKELSVRWMCAGTKRKAAKRISAWVLLKHR